jgi:hypothetical protein
MVCHGSPMRVRTTTSTLVACAIVAMAGCGSAHQGATTGGAQATAQAAALTPSQTACTAGIDAFNAIAKPLIRQDPAATVAAAQQWSTALDAITGAPGLSSAVQAALGREAGGIAGAGITAQEPESDPVSYPWSTVMTPAEQQLDADFSALENACQTVGVHT